MKQLIQSARTGKLSVADVPEPAAAEGEVLVRTRASLISAGTERMIVDFAKKGLVGKARARPDLVRKVLDKARRDGAAAAFRAVMSRLDEPLPLGYSAAGEIAGLGRGVEGRFRIGQRVAIAGAGLANHAELNAVPVNLVAAVPDDVNDEEACFGTLAAIALHGVRNMGLEIGDVAAVLGVGLVGQLAVEFLDLAGVRVVAIDVRNDRLELAKFGGAQFVWNLADGDPTKAIFDFTSGWGCDGVLIAAATDDSTPFQTAAAIARDRARVSVVGMTGTEFPYREFMQKELSLVVSRSYGPGRYDDDFERRGMKYPPGYVRWTETRNLEYAMRIMTRRRDRRLHVEQLITHRFDLADAESAYRLVTENTEPNLGVVLRYPTTALPRGPRVMVPRHVSAPAGAGQCVVGVIGAGNFARAVLLPRLKANKACRLHTVVTKRGATAEHVRGVFGFEQSATDVAAALANDAINAVVIATPHGSHASLVATALAAGKHVFVEKPLALGRDELGEVAAAQNRSAAFFQVGFNRRFAPYAIAARDHMARAGGKKFVVIRVNAGALPAESALNSAENGYGRLLGEACHFVDLARFLVGSRIASVHAMAARLDSGVCDDVSATLAFADGGLATIAYTSLGDPSAAKERIEGYAGGTVVAIEDFRRMTVVVDGKTRRMKEVAGQDKGHAAELDAFVAAVASGGPAPVDAVELIQIELGDHRDRRIAAIGGDGKPLVKHGQSKRWPMRILVHDYAGHPFPVQLSRALARRGHDVHHFYTTFFQGPKGAVERRPSDPRNLIIEGLSLGSPFAKYSFVKRLGQEIAYGRMLADRLAAIAPDVVLSANNPLDPQAILQRRARDARIPFVFWLQDLYSIAIDRILRRRWPAVGAAIGYRYRRLESRLLRASDAVIGITADFGPSLLAWGVPEAKIDIIGNWAPLDEMPHLPHANAWAREHGLDDKVTLLYSGSLGLKHDPSLLLKLAERFSNRPQVKVVVVSEGQGADWLRQRLGQPRTSGLLLLPFQSHARFPEVLASAAVHLAVLEPDAGVFSVPSKILNYLASGRPTVAAMPRENLAARMLTENAAGLVVPPGDADGFAVAVQSLLDAPHRRTAMGDSARAYAEMHFAIEPICDRFEAVLRRVRGIDPVKREAYA